MRLQDELSIAVMAFFIFLLSLLAISSAKSVLDRGFYAERECGNDFQKLWIDVVFVVDVSRGMTDEGLKTVRAQITSMFQKNQTLGIDKYNNYTTRVGLVLYNEAARVAFDLNEVTSREALENKTNKHLNKVSDSDISYLDTGLQMASEMFTDTQYIEKTKVSREHYQKLIFVYASTYKKVGKHDPEPVAQRLKTSGISISTIAYGQDRGSYLKNLAKIASPRFAFTHNSARPIILRNVAMEVNCYCPPNWFQMADPATSGRIGVCIRPVSLSVDWDQAEKTCMNMRRGGHLVHVYSKSKQDFIQEKMGKEYDADVDDYSYFIGLKWDNGRFEWDQDNYGRNHTVLNGYEPWSIGYPRYPLSSYSTVVAKQVSADPRKFEWQNVDEDADSRYVCEMPSCDSTRYCDGSLDDV